MHHKLHQTSIRHITSLFTVTWLPTLLHQNVKHDLVMYCQITLKCQTKSSRIISLF